MPTQLDVARRAKVSYMTVSRVINNKTNVKPATRARVLKAIEELNYFPNAAAQALTGSPTLNVGIIFPQQEFILNRPYFIELSMELEQNLSANGYHLHLGSVRDQGNPREIAQLAGEKRVDGLIIFAPQENDPRLSVLDKNIIPYTIIHGHGVNRESSCVNSDIRAGMTLLLDHLTSLGHTRIAFVSVNLLEEDARIRLETYRNYCAGHNLSEAGELIHYGGDWTLETGYQAFEQLCKLNPAPTAILFSNDQMALGAIKAANDKGIKIPRDISIAGIDDIKYASYASPALTTVRYSIPDIARTAVSQILSNIQEGNIKDHALFPPELIIRESTGPVEE